MIWSSCQTDDILTQIVAIELLRFFAETKNGLSYLFSSNIFSWLISVAYNSISNEQGKLNTNQPSDPILASQCLREISEIFYRTSKHHYFDESLWNRITEQGIQ